MEGKQEISLGKDGVMTKAERQQYVYAFVYERALQVGRTLGRAKGYGEDFAESCAKSYVETHAEGYSELFAEGYAEGFAQGFAEGLALAQKQAYTEKLASARSIKTLGLLSNQQIAQALCLPLSEVEKV